MLRLVAILAVLTAFPAASFAARPADFAPTGVTVARLVSCDVTAPDRAASFYARMDTIAGASKLQLRFQLLERLGRNGWNRLDVPALRQWRAAPAGGPPLRREAKGGWPRPRGGPQNRAPQT